MRSTEELRRGEAKALRVQCGRLQIVKGFVLKEKSLDLGLRTMETKMHGLSDGAVCISFVFSR